VRFSVDGVKVFYGFVFTKKRDKQHHIEVTAYDQLRYLTNKDTYIYTNKTASDVIRMVADDFNLQLGEIASTSFTIPTRVEDNTTLYDIIYNALDLELTNTRHMYVLYDDFGKLTLKALDSMRLGVVIDEETGENFEYSSTIDDQTYNKVKLTYENEETSKRDIYVVQDGEHINDWGILQHFDTLQQGENGEAKAAALLDLYNAKTRKLKIVKAFGDLRVRAGTLPIIQLGLGDINVKNYMLVEKATHTFYESEHYMDLNVRGGEFVG
jgi:cellulose synthase/poly-beta-1,6-N-acetylglucosamine synthase-like glycosyltransferase